jgi:hypothetical protein
MKPTSAFLTGFLFLTIALRCHAVEVLAGPLFTPSPNAPLAGTLQLTTDVNARISVLVSDGNSLWEHDDYQFGTNHSLTLLGFKPGETNEILVMALDPYRNLVMTPQPLKFVTPSLPAGLGKITILKSVPDQMEPGYTLYVTGIRNGSRNYATIIDQGGNVVWYSSVHFNDVDVRQLTNGDLLLPDQSNKFYEINMLGNLVRALSPPTNYPINLHDAVPTAAGTILYISDTNRVVTNFPNSDTNSNAAPVTVTVDDNPVVEISTNNGALLNAWSPLAILDPTRVTYLTYTSGSYSGAVVDNEHGNAVVDVPQDQCIIESLRDQNTVFKFSRATGALKWILSDPANWGPAWQPYLLKPVGEPFVWNYAQHAPMLTPQGTLLLYDDGNFQASPFAAQVPDKNNYSRALEYSIDETNLQVSEVWDSSWQTNQDRLFTPILGKAQWLTQTRDVLVTYGYVTYINGSAPSSHSINATMSRIIEYTHDPIPQVVFDAEIWDPTNTSAGFLGYGVYRALRIPDLYVHPPVPVNNLIVTYANKLPHLEFAADPTRTYLVQASTDLKTWTTIGSPVQNDTSGDFDFYDLYALQFSSRYYRVVTQ